MNFVQKYRAILILALGFAFIIIGNRIYVPVPFDLSLESTFVKIFMAIIGMAIMPIAAIKILFKENIRDYGISVPKIKRRDLGLFAGIILINLPILYLFSNDNWFQRAYNFRYDLGDILILAEIAIMAAYYVSEELLFRGFLFWGLYNKLGFKSFWITTFIFMLAHSGKNYKEIIYSGFASLLFCWTSLKYKSFVPAAIIHFALALILNTLIYYA